MKIAIVCDWLVNIGGAEKCLSSILRCFPEADLFAVIEFVHPNQRDFLHQKQVTTTFIQHLPFAKKFYRQYLPWMPLAIEQLNLEGYELIISCSHAVAKGVLTGPDQLHISYVHSPMRYAWDLQHQYLRESGLEKKMRGLFARYLLHKMRLWDLRSANGVDYFIANSKFIARRIQKVYRRDSTVIHPPIDTDHFTPCYQKENFYVTASRLVPYKRIDLIVESFQSMPDKKLIVIGDGPEFSKIRKMASANVSLLGYQSHAVLVQYLQRAKAFIFAAEEDFGLLPVEAQSCGTPVIAYGKGGALETVRGLDQEHPTGIFFQHQTVDSLSEAIHSFERQQSLLSAEYCVSNAKKFTVAQFETQFKNFIREKCADHFGKI